MSIAIKDVVQTYYTLKMHKLYQFAMSSTTKAKKPTINNAKFDIFNDKYLSQDLTSILHNTLDVSSRREGEWGLPLHNRLQAA